ncbi:DeoR/GlpR family DNA-binding transcription regulator [Sulfobacillus sp. hq2]|uniref:DeoR/GlpR family DNA-binding transcription regulator n=1 Tax=Sulfobacillus TaxID=28033 RepID=UPI000CD3085D|nr:DeoR/GlpR family DNA-binding transcription regulator [Sulfobacillus sp. hq2]POB11037.1 DeoR family transcriptional regulator [Sulfobacillus sp. hq2]
MNPQERREQLLTWIARHGTASIQQLAQVLHVSEMTVRRDLRILQQAHLLQSIPGGAEVKKSATELAFDVKRRLHRDEKEAIAAKALELIDSDMTIAFSAGTTTWAVAHRIRGFQQLTFVTNSTNIALELQQNGWTQIVLTGGNFRTPSDALVGPFAEYTARHLHTDVLFLGVHGLDVEAGMTTPNIQEAAIDRVLIEQAQKVVVVMDHSKWGIKALARIAPIEMVDAIITTRTPHVQAHIAACERLGIEVFTATLPDQGSKEEPV